MTALRILIADDHELIRRGLRNLLASQTGWEIVGEAHHGADALEKVIVLQPDVAILDYSMPVMEGPEVASQIRQRCPGTQVIVLTMHDSDPVIRQVLRSGAKGYVLKSEADLDLIAAVETVSQRRRFFPRHIDEAVLSVFLAERAETSPARQSRVELTARERQVLVLLADGVSSKEIASRLMISVRTVESHRIHINRKMGFGSIADLVRYAIRHGMVAPH